MADIVVFGAGPGAEAVSVYLEAHSGHRIVAYTADRSHIDSPTFRDRPLLAWETLEATHPPHRVQLLGPLSYRRLNRFRAERYLQGRQRGYEFISFVHPGVENLGFTTGDNCIVLAGCIIEPFARIGSNVMIWSGAHIGHHTRIADHCFIGPGAGIGGQVHIGEYSFFGPRACVASSRTIGARCFFGAGAQTTVDAPDDTVFNIGIGTPPSRYRSNRITRLV